MTTDLTDRYVWAVVRLLPEQQRADIDAELRSLVADDLDARLENPESSDDPVAAERAVLAELGDPARMAAGYADPQRSLVGPELFPAYIRTLKVIAAIAVPAMAGLAAIGESLEEGGATFGDVLGAAIGGAYQAAIQVALWVTLFYAVTGWRRSSRDWTPDDLPDLPASRTAAGGPGVSEMAFEISLTVFAGILLVGQHVWPFLRNDAGEAVPALDPAIWGGAGQALLVLLAASLAVQVTVMVRHGWTTSTATVNAGVNVASLAIVAWAAFGGWFINEEMLEVIAERSDWASTPSIDPWLIVLLIGAVEAWDTFDAFRHARGRTEAVDAAA